MLFFGWRGPKSAPRSWTASGAFPGNCGRPRRTWRLKDCRAHLVQQFSQEADQFERFSAVHDGKHQAARKKLTQLAAGLVPSGDRSAVMTRMPGSVEGPEVQLPIWSMPKGRMYVLLAGLVLGNTGPCWLPETEKAWVQKPPKVQLPTPCPGRPLGFCAERPDGTGTA